MAPIFTNTTPATTSNQLETPVIIVICICCYLAFFIIAVFIRQCIVSSGLCPGANICGKADETNNCCDCCLEFAEACNCRVAGVTGCCDQVCGPRKHCDPADCLTCGLCGEDSNSYKCDCCSCPGCSCSSCGCPGFHCDKPDCSQLRCLCCTISCKDAPIPDPPPQPYPYFNQGQGQAYPYSYPYPPPHNLTQYNYPNTGPVGYYPQPGSFQGRNTRAELGLTGQYNITQSNLFQSTVRQQPYPIRGYSTSERF